MAELTKPTWIEDQPIIQYWILSQYQEFLNQLRHYEKSLFSHDLKQAQMILKKTRFYVQSLVSADLTQYKTVLKALNIVEKKLTKRHYRSILSRGVAVLGEGYACEVVTLKKVKTPAVIAH